MPPRKNQSQQKVSHCGTKRAGGKEEVFNQDGITPAIEDKLGKTIIAGWKAVGRRFLRLRSKRGRQ